MRVWQRRGKRFHPDCIQPGVVIGGGVGYGVPKFQIRPGHSQRKPQFSSLQGCDFGTTSGASLWRPCLSRSSHLHAWWGNATHCHDFDAIPAPVSHGSASFGLPSAWLKSNWACMGLHQTTSERNEPTCTIIGRAARSDPWGVASYATAVCHTSDSQYAEERGSSYCGRWWLHTLLTVIVLSLISFCLFICHYVISLWYACFYPCICLYMFTPINKLIVEDSYCSYRFSVHFLLDCLHHSASCTKIGNLWTLRLGILENNHITPALSISFQFCRKPIKHLLYHIAYFDGGTQCAIWGVLCIFMKSTSCSSGCTPSPWTWLVFHITVFFCVFSVYYTPFSATSALFGQCAILQPPLPSSQWLAIAGWWYFTPWQSQTDRSQKVDFWGG